MLMEQQLLGINQEIDKAYASMNRNPYHLHAICIHDGNANSGHYYALIKDHGSGKWRRFNDIRVADIAPEDVFKEANGGHSWMTAYWLVYINQSITS